MAADERTVERERKIGTLVGYPEIAARLRYPDGSPVPVNSLYTWKARGQFPEPAIQIGRRVAWRWSDVRRWALKEGLVTA